MDPEWKVLFYFQRDFTEKSGISAIALIKFLGFEQPSKVCRFFYSEIERPSMRPHTIGFQVRERLKEFMKTHSQFSTFHTPELTFPDKILELFFDNKSAFEEFGITEMFGKQDNGGSRTINVNTDRFMTSKQVKSFIANYDSTLVEESDSIKVTTWFPANTTTLDASTSIANQDAQ